VKTMAAVLAGHWSASTHTEREPFVDKCDGCGEVVYTWGDPISGPLATHQQAMLTAAGFGKLPACYSKSKTGRPCILRDRHMTQHQFDVNMRPE